jgi:hypothetical protein
MRAFRGDYPGNGQIISAAQKHTNRPQKHKASSTLCLGGKSTSECSFLCADFQTKGNKTVNSFSAVPWCVQQQLFDRILEPEWVYSPTAQHSAPKQACTSAHSRGTRGSEFTTHACLDLQKGQKKNKFLVALVIPTMTQRKHYNMGGTTKSKEAASGFCCFIKSIL